MKLWEGVGNQNNMDLLTEIIMSQIRDGESVGNTSAPEQGEGRQKVYSQLECHK